MALLKRIFLFGIVNILVVITLMVVVTLLGALLGIDLQGSHYGSLLFFSLVWGMGGAFVSLLLSRTMAKWMMGVEVIDPGTRDPYLRQLVETVHRLARRAGIARMPEVGLYRSPEVNAFATGPGKNSALVAVSTGLLERMSDDEVEGVLGHEVAHISNGDMVTMTLIQGVVNAFVIFFARMIALAVSNLLRGDDEEEGGFASMGVYFLVSIVMEILLGILGMMVVAFFSRFREFRADSGGAALAGRERMIRALQALKRTYDIQDNRPHQAVATLQISGHPAGLMALFSTHPPLDERIRRLARAG